MHPPDPTIPDASYSALFAYEEDRTRVTPEETIRAVAAPLIAAELIAATSNLSDRLKGYMAEMPAGAVDLINDWWWATRNHARELAPVETDAVDGKPV